MSEKSRIGAIIEKNKIRRQVARALGSGGIEVDFAANATELVAMDREKRLDLLVVEVTAIADSIAGTVEQLTREAQGRPLMLLSFGQSHDTMIELIRRNDISNVVSTHGALGATVAEFDERELLVTCMKVLSGDIFGIDKYVGAWGAKLHDVTIAAVKDKAPALDGLESLLRSLQCSTTIIPDIVNVADELLLNAIVHAPRGPDGKQRYEHIGPAKTLELLPNERVRMTYGCDGQRLMLGVRDNFGALGRDTLYKYVSKGFGEDPKLSPEDKVSGAGLGLTLAFRSIHQLICNVQVGARTEIIAGWYLPVASALEFRRIGKSFNLFWIG